MEDLFNRNVHLVERIRKYESEDRFAHTLRMTELAISYAECYGIDRNLTWKTGMLHDIAKEMSTDEMIASAEKYGHTVSQFCLNNPGFMHAEVGALIAEHEFGLKDRAGILTALILYILGCSKEDIICDYTASAVSFRTMTDLLKHELQRFGYSREIQNKLHKILSVAPEEISSFLDDMESHYGSSGESIMKAIGLGEQELKALRDKYLE